MTRAETGFQRAHDPMRVARVTAAVVAVLLLAGCGQAPAEPSPADLSTTGPAPTSASGESPCDLLDEATVVDLAGGFADGTVGTIPGTAISACTFDIVTDQPFHIQVARVPADEWARSLPGVVATLRNLPEGTVDATILAQLDEASALLEQGDSIPAGEACRYFSQLLETGGYDAGTTTSVNYIPYRDSAVAISGQQCLEGVYSTLLVAPADADQSPDLAQKVERALARLG